MHMAGVVVVVLVCLEYVCCSGWLWVVLLGVVAPVVLMVLVVRELVVAVVGENVGEKACGKSCGKPCGKPRELFHRHSHPPPPRPTHAPWAPQPPATQPTTNHTSHVHLRLKSNLKAKSETHISLICRCFHIFSRVFRS